MQQRPNSERGAGCQPQIERGLRRRGQVGGQGPGTADKNTRANSNQSPGYKQQRNIAGEHQQNGSPISTRRLRRSISAGRLLSTDELSVPENDRGIENHIPFVNRLVGWWRRMQQDRFLDKATPEQREALKRDLEPVISIYDQL